MDELIIDNPFTLEDAARCPLSAPAQADEMLTASQNASFDISALSVDQRVSYCAGAIDHMLAEAERLATQITAMMGKPLAESRGEVRTMASRARHMMEIAPASLASRKLDERAGYERRIERVPLGVVFNMPAWNYPLLTAVNVVIPAFLAGNAVLIKHSSRSALCGEHFAEAFAAAGAPPQSCQAIHCSHEVAGQIAGDRRVAYVGFTGSVSGGRAVYRSVAQRSFADVGLELGGKDAAYIRDDANIEAAAAGVVEGACYNAGQSCCAVERVYVHRKRYQELLDAAESLMQKLKLGDPTTDVDMGPMAQRDAPAFLAEQVSAARADGARIVLGGTPCTSDGRGRFFEPTLIADVTPDMAVMREESFGPLLPIMPVDSDAQALTLMNDSDFGLTASIWTQDSDQAAQLASQLAVGTVFMNQCDVLDPALPWTGVKDSGKGSTLSTLAFHHLTRPRSINFKH